MTATSAQQLRRAAALGPDRSEPVATLEGGWMIRRLRTLEDQHRDGELMRNCLREYTTAHPNLYSLRDPKGIPHATFSLWTTTHLDDVPTPAAEILLICGDHAACLALGRANSQLRAEHIRHLRAFCDLDTNLDQHEQLPARDAQQLRAFLRAICHDSLVMDLGLPLLTIGTYRLPR